MSDLLFVNVDELLLVFISFSFRLAYNFFIHFFSHLFNSVVTLLLHYLGPNLYLIANLTGLSQ